MATVLDKIATEKRNVKFFLPAILGTILEYYDYALYGFCAPTLAAHFFPGEDKTTALLKTFGIFVVGSCSKPLGALIFGHLGDYIGRSKALKMSLFGIVIPTTVVGLLPSYDHIGGLAPLLLLLCRMVQGILVSGEYEGVRIFIFESVGKERPNFVNSLADVASMLGIYSASLVMNFSLSPNLPDWAWRVPFVMGGIFGFFVMWARRNYLPETPLYLQYRAGNAHHFINPLWQVIKKHKKNFLLALLLSGTVGGGYHFYLIFWGNYLKTSLTLFESPEISFYGSWSVLIYTICGPIAGWLCDRLGSWRVAKWALYCLLPLIAFNGFLLTQNRMPFWIMALTSAVLAFFHTPGFVTVLEKFEVSERYRCVSLSHALGSMLLSGTAPMMSLWLWKFTQCSLAPLFYFACLSMVGFLALSQLLRNGSIPDG